MDYRRSITYLFGLQRFGIKLGLANIEKLLSLLGNPHKKLRFVHIAGTNGKGSTAAFLHYMLTCSGYRAGLFTSPHLINFTERIKIGTEEIPRTQVARMVTAIRDICVAEGLETITFFEFISALALLFFAEEKADPVVLETGMGGRLDATNVVRPLVSVITSISHEHQQYLGTTLLQIAGEKAGIIKEKAPLVTGARQAAVLRLFAGRCRELHAPVYVLGQDIRCRSAGAGAIHYRGLGCSLKNARLGLIGDHQARNAGLALATAELMRDRGFILSEQDMLQGLQETRWPGRLEIIRQNPAVLLDGAHNPEAWRTLRSALKKYFRFRRLIMVIGVMQDKDIDRIIETLTPEAHTVIFCKPKMDRSAGRPVIEPHLTASVKRKSLWIEDTAEAIQKALKQAASDDLICVTGSLFTVGEAREHLLPLRLPASGRIPM